MEKQRIKTGCFQLEQKQNNAPEYNIMISKAYRVL